VVINHKNLQNFAHMHKKMNTIPTNTTTSLMKLQVLICEITKHIIIIIISKLVDLIQLKQAY